MTGTSDLSRAQLDVINDEAEAGFPNLGGTGRVEKIVITPVTGSQQSVKVTFSIVGYGTSWIVVERDGTIAAREHPTVDVPDLLREAVSEYVSNLREDDDPHNNRLAAALEDVWIEADGTWGPRP